jgi:hypothetical protein
MAVIGATQLEAPNMLGSFVGGLEAGRSALAQRRKEAEALQSQRQKEALNLLITSGAADTPEGRNALARMPGGFEVLSAYGESQEKLGKGLEAQTKGLSDRLQLWKRMLPSDPAGAAQWVQSAYADPIVGPELAKLGSKEEVTANIPTDPAKYMQWAEGVSMFADEYAKRRTMTAEQLSTAETARRGQDITAATARRGQDIEDATKRRGQDLEKDTKERQQNLETFFGKDKTGKEAAKDVAGAEAFQGVIDEMRTAYNELDRLNAIPSSQRRTAAENLGIYATETSGLAQMAGRATGTPAQSLRNQVQSARLRLLQGIKAATNMSAQELNSNVELQQWLDAVTNPANDIESNMAVLNSIENFVATKSGKQMSAKPKPKPEAPPSSSIDALLEKYK